MWQYTGQKRPSFAEQPKAGQESVWDYPRPPRVEVCQHIVEVIHKVNVIARSVETYRVLETASPPTFYIPKQDIDWSLLVETSMTSVCEWKGLATYWKLATDPDGPPVAWRYDDPKRTTNRTPILRKPKGSYRLDIWPLLMVFKRVQAKKAHCFTIKWRTGREISV